MYFSPAAMKRGGSYETLAVSSTMINIRTILTPCLVVLVHFFLQWGMIPSMHDSEKTGHV